MTTQYNPHGQTEENIFTDAVGRQNGLNEALWITAFELWQEGQDWDEPGEPVWSRLRTGNDELPMVDISAKLEEGNWLFMVAYRGEDNPDYDPNGDEVHEPDEDTDRPMVGRSTINIPLPYGWDHHQ